MKALAILILSAVSVQARAETSFQVACSADLNSAGKIIKLRDVSAEFGNSTRGFSDSYVKLVLGPIELTAFVQMSRLDGDAQMEPTLNVMLFKGNPVTGQIGFARVKGMDLDTRPIGIPLVVNSLNFLDFEYNGSRVSRVDYRCSINRLR